MSQEADDANAKEGPGLLVRTGNALGFAGLCGLIALVGLLLLKPELSGVAALATFVLAFPFGWTAFGQVVGRGWWDIGHYINF